MHRTDRQKRDRQTDRQAERQTDRLRRQTDSLRRIAEQSKKVPGTWTPNKIKQLDRQACMKTHMNESS